MQALRLCLDRLAPPAKDSPVAFDLPEMKRSTTRFRLWAPLSKRVGQGDLTPTEWPAELTKWCRQFAKIIETAELEERRSKTGRGDRQMTLDRRLSKLVRDFARSPAPQGRDDSELPRRRGTWMRRKIATSQPIPRTGVLPSLFFLRKMLGGDD